MIRKPRILRAAGVALAATLLAVALGVAAPSRSGAGTSERSDEAACIAAATEMPQLLRVHFIIHRQPARELGHREVFIPMADVKFAINPMPDECAEKIGRRLEVKIRFKSSLQPPMSVKGNDWHLHPSLWQIVFLEDAGSGMCGCGRPQIGRDGGSWDYSRNFGRVKWVEAHARLTATNARTEATIKQRVVSIPATFTAKPTLSNH